MNKKHHQHGTQEFYSPLGAAIRWSDRLEQELNIQDQTERECIPLREPRTDWPLLHQNIERLIDAMNHGKLPYSKTGFTRRNPAVLALLELSIKHVDLERWMTLTYPPQTSSFLFDASQRQPQISGKTLGDEFTARSCTRVESTYLNIIGALLTLLLGHSPSGTRYSAFSTLKSVTNELITHHSGRPGITERTLWTTFADAKRHLSAEP